MRTCFHTDHRMIPNYIINCNAGLLLLISLLPCNNIAQGENGQDKSWFLPTSVSMPRWTEWNIISKEVIPCKLYYSIVLYNILTSAYPCTYLLWFVAGGGWCSPNGRVVAKSSVVPWAKNDKCNTCECYRGGWDCTYDRCVTGTVRSVNYQWRN